MRYFNIINYLALILIFIPYSINAKDLGIHGRVWEIKEQNIVSYIKNMLGEKDMQKFNQDFKDRVKDGVNRPMPVKGIIKSSKNKVHYFNPEITLKKDIADHNGRVLHKKGTKINPLDHQQFTRKLLFIDGDIKSHVNYALKKHKEIGEDLKIVLINGSPIELMKKNQNMRFYFDQKGYLTTTFGIKMAPSLIQKEGRLIRVESIVLEEL